MKKIFLFVLVLFWLAGPAVAKEYQVEKKAGEYTVHISMDKNPPVAGSNVIKINIKDAAGNWVTDAQVAVEYAMPAMPGMPAASYKEKTELQEKTYRGQINFSMPGSWSVAVKITRSGKIQTVKFNVDVS
jgi:hypothetical protein